MAVKKAQIIIDVDSKSLEQLNNEIKALESSIDSLKIGTDEWNQANARLGDLKRDFSEAATEAANLQGEIDQIGTAEQIQGVVKLGSGMVGAFTVANGALSLLGENEAFEKMTAQATTLMSIMGGLQQVSELFGTSTGKALKSVGKGFGNLTRTVKVASNSMKASLIASGVGILLIGVGLLIAKWDDLTNAIGRARKQRELGREQDRLENQVSTMQNIIASEEKRVAHLKKINELNGDLDKNAQLDIELGRKKVELLGDQAKLHEVITTQTQLQTEKEERKIGRALIPINGFMFLRKKFLIDQNAEIEKSLNLEKELSYSIDETNQALLTQQEINKQLVKDELIRLKIYGDTGMVAALEDQIKILETQRFTEDEIYEIEQERLNILIDELDYIEKVNGFLTQEQEIKRAGYIAEREANFQSNKLREDLLKIDNELLQNEILRNREIDKFNNAVTYSNKKLKEQQEIQRKNQVDAERAMKLYDIDLDTFEKAKQIRDEIVNFDVRRGDILERRLEIITKKYQSELKVTKEGYNDILGFLDVYSKRVEAMTGLPLENLDFFAKQLISDTESYYKIFEDAGIVIDENIGKQTRASSQLKKDAAVELSIKKIGAELVLENLDKQEEALKSQLATTKVLQSTYQKNFQELQQSLTKISETQPLQDQLYRYEIEVAETKKRMEADERGGLLTKEKVDEYNKNLKIIQDKQKEAFNDLAYAAENSTAPLDVYRKRWGEIIKLEMQGVDVTEEKAFVLSEINKFEANYASLQDQVNSTESELLNQKIQETVLEDNILDTKYEIQLVNDGLENSTTEITNGLIDQLRVYKQMQDFAEKYSDEIAAAADLVNELYEYQIAKQTQIADDAARAQVDAIKNQEALNKEVEKSQKLYDELNKKNLSETEKLQELQKDANGERYAEIEARLQILADEKKQIETDLAAEMLGKATLWQNEEDARKAAFEAEQDALEAAAKARRKQAIIDTVIQSALAVVSALPNIILAAVVAALGIAAVATISAQKIPPKVEYVPAENPYGMKEGGYTGDGKEDEEAGVVHKGEYVVPARIVKSQSAQPLIEALEEQRKKGYVSGGYVTPNAEVNYQTFDYDKFFTGMADVVSSLPPPQVGLVNISNGLKDVQLSKQQAGLTR